MNICDAGYYNIIKAYLLQMADDYKRAVEKNNLDELLDIETAIESDDYLGDICEVSASTMLRHIRAYGYDNEKYIIERNRNGYPVNIIRR